MHYYLLLVSIPFLYFNYKIILSDFKSKIIPNKHLLYLIAILPFFYIYLFLSLKSINFLGFFGTIFLTTFTSFILYYFWIWSAWDAKYLLVLSLYIPNIWIIPFIWNIAVLTLIYLIFYFLYFYIVKIWFNKRYRKSLIENIITDNKEKMKIFFTNWNAWKIERKTIFYKLLKTIIIFLTIFVILRLSRIYIIDGIRENLLQYETDNLNIKNIFSGYLPHIIWWWVILSFLLLFTFRKIYSLFFKYFIKYLKIDTKKTDMSFKFLLVILSLLISFIIFEYLKTWTDVLNKLYLIFTLYLWMYIIFKILFYSYKITFHLAENSYIDISNLKPWEIIDKDYLIKLFWTQHILWAKSENQNKDWLLYPNPIKYFQNIDNPVDEETTEIIKKAYSEVNNYHKEINNGSFEEKKDIKILKTFAFSSYIFVWFLITFLIQDKIFKYVSNVLYDIIKNIYN